MFVVWENARGYKRYQPATADRRMVWMCAMGSCIRTWINDDDADKYGAVKFWFRWQAVLMTSLYERRMERALSLRYYARGAPDA